MNDNNMKVNEDSAAIRRLAFAAAEEVMPGTMHSLLVRRLGFPRQSRHKGSTLSGQGENLVIIRMSQSGSGEPRADWMFVEWTAGKKENNESRVVVATGSFSPQSQSQGRVTIQAVGLGNVVRKKEAGAEAGQTIEFKGAAKVGGSGQSVYRTEDIGERRLYALCAGFNTDGRKNCSVHHGIMDKAG